MDGFVRVKSLPSLDKLKIVDIYSTSFGKVREYVSKTRYYRVVTRYEFRKRVHYYYSRKK